RIDHLVDELRARRGEEGRLGPRRDRAALEQERAQALAELRPARLARGDDGPALLAQRRREQLDLRRLAAAVDPLESHEHWQRRPRRRTTAVLCRTAGALAAAAADAAARPGSLAT